MIKISSYRKAPKGEMYVPGDKSISHRAIMIGALAQGTTEITGFLYGDDCIATVECFRKLGISIDIADRVTGGVPTVTVHGKGLYGLSEPDEALYVGNSGTTIRLLSGILAAQKFESEIFGDESILKRPMERIMDPLNKMGGHVSSKNNNGCAPLIIEPGKVNGASYHGKVSSAQVKSAVLFMGLYADTETVFYDPGTSRNHTEVMLAHFGADIQNRRTLYGATASILHPGFPLTGRQISIPGDISSAAYFIAAALLVPGSELLIKNVGINKTRNGILSVFKQMGASIELVNIKNASEPSADIYVRHSDLRGSKNGSIEIRGKIIPTLIDELPLIAVVAATVNCTTIIKDAAELKTKETNRIRVVCDNLRAMGCDITEEDDGMTIHGGKPLTGANIKTHGDHRIAMSFAIAALIAKGETTIDDPDCATISYPGFFDELHTLTGAV